MLEFDLCVIGSGPGGQKAAIQAAKFGRRVCVVERMESVGGVALHTGTIPSKALREAIIKATYGYDPWSTRADVQRGHITIEKLMDSCQKIIAQEIHIVRSQLERNGVILLNGIARFEDSETVYVEGNRFKGRVRAEKFIVAVGTVPAKPGEIPFDGESIFTSDDLIQLKSIPKSMLVLGGGVIGTEYASMFARLGVQVTLVERAPRLLGFLDYQIGDALQYYLREQGMTLRLNDSLSRIEKTSGAGGERVALHLECGTRLSADILLYCLGRQGATEGLRLEAVGLKADRRGRLAVDRSYQTANPHIYAIGDVIGFPSLASTSMDQGRVAACNLYADSCISAPQLFPYGIYSIPEIAMVGRTEEQLTAENVPFETGVAQYKEIARGQLLGDEIGMLKLLFHRESRQLLGIHILGTQATELIHIGQAVIAFQGKVNYFADTAFNYPTLAECYKVAALNGLNKLQS